MTTSGKTTESSKTTTKIEEDGGELMGSAYPSQAIPGMLTAAGAAALVPKQVG